VRAAAVDRIVTESVQGRPKVFISYRRGARPNMVLEVLSLGT
jgi:hypothetical protein